MFSPDRGNFNEAEKEEIELEGEIVTSNAAAFHVKIILYLYYEFQTNIIDYECSDEDLKQLGEAYTKEIEAEDDDQLDGANVEEMDCE